MANLYSVADLDSRRRPRTCERGQGGGGGGGGVQEMKEDLAAAGCVTRNDAAFNQPHPDLELFLEQGE